MKFFDSHAHFNDEKFDEDRDEIIKELKNEEIAKVICTGYNIESSKFAIELAEKYDNIYSTVGISPNDVPQNMEELWIMLAEIERLCTNKKVVAIGEIGLDYYWVQDNKEIQQTAFIEQIKIANKYNLPIVIHTREAVADTIDIIKNKMQVMKKGVFHCCPLNRELVKEALKLDFYISFAGPVTFKNSKNAEEVVRQVPNDKMLIETDSPYLSPEPLRGKRNDSRNVKLIAQKIADFKELPLELVAKNTYDNASKLFNICD